MRLFKVLILSCVLLCMFVMPAIGEATEEPKEIVIITSYSIDNSFSNKLIKGIIDALGQSPLEIYYHIEYKDEYREINRTDYHDHMVETLRRYEGLGIDGIVAIGYEALGAVSQALTQGESNIPLVIGGVDNLYIQNTVDYPYVYYAPTSFDVDEYIGVMADIQPMLEKVYFLFPSDSREEFYGDLLTMKLEQRGIVVEHLKVNELDQLSETKGQKVPNTEAIVVSVGSWNSEQEWRNPNELFSKIKEQYSDPVYWIEGTQFYEILKWGDGGREPVSVTYLGTDQDAANMGYYMRTVLEGSEVLPRQIIPVQRQTRINYSGLKSHDLYAKELSDKYEWINLPKRIISIPREVGLVVLGGIACLFLLITTNLYRKYRRKQRLLKQNEQSRQRYNNLLSNVSHGIIKVNGINVEYINPKAAELLEAEEQSLVGIEIFLLFPNYAQWIEIEPGQGVEREKIETRGQEWDVEINWVDIPDHPNARLLVIRDLTEEQKKQEELELVQMRTEFFSTLSQEVKRPMRNILSVSQQLEQWVGLSPNEMMEKYIQIIKYNGYRLSKIVGNLIDTTKVTTGALDLDLQPVDFVQFTGQLVESITPLAKDKGITIQNETSPEPIYGLVDYEKYERIVLNLLMNGIKYNKPNGKVSLQLLAQQEMVVLRIADTGIGIPKELQQDIFSPFNRVNEYRDCSIEGSGLGLTIVKSFVELHGGTISLESAEGEYSQFTILLPKQQLSAEQIEQIKNQETYALFSTDVELVLQEVGEGI